MSERPRELEADPVQGLEAVEQDALATLLAHRAALARGDGTALEETLARGARHPSERDLLVDLVAAEGAGLAARRLARFWRHARTEVVSVRSLREDELEVYERIEVDRAERPLFSVTLLRANGQGRWGVVATSDAPEHRLRMQVLTRGMTPIDDVAYTRALYERYGPEAELLMTGWDGVLGHPARDWLASVRGPVSAQAARKIHPEGTTGTLVDVALAPSGPMSQRRAQMAWLARTLLVLAERLRSRKLYLPAHDKPLAPGTLDRLAAETRPTASALLPCWAALHERRGRIYSSGLLSFGLPELFTETSHWGESAVARGLLGAVARALVDERIAPEAGASLVVSGHRCALITGPRGPRAGRTFGRFGALELRPAEGLDQRHSDMVARVQ